MDELREGCFRIARDCVSARRIEHPSFPHRVGRHGELPALILAALGLATIAERINA
jgi:hypothetical protein